MALLDFSVWGIFQTDTGECLQVFSGHEDRSNRSEALDSLVFFFFWGGEMWFDDDVVVVDDDDDDVVVVVVDVVVVDDDDDDVVVVVVDDDDNVDDDVVVVVDDDDDDYVVVVDDDDVDDDDVDDDDVDDDDDDDDVDDDDDDDDDDDNVVSHEIADVKRASDPLRISIAQLPINLLFLVELWLHVVYSMFFPISTTYFPPLCASSPGIPGFIFPYKDMVLSVAFLTVSSFNLAPASTKDVDGRSQAQIWPIEAPNPNGSRGVPKKCCEFFAGETGGNLEANRKMSKFLL